MTWFTFTALSEQAKDRVRERAHDNLDGEWYQYTLEDTVRIAELLGIVIEPRRDFAPPGSAPHTHHGQYYFSPTPPAYTGIYFSDFWTQGSGASFTGSYFFSQDAVEKITAEAPKDEELLRIARELTAAQTTARLLHRSHVNVRIDGYNQGYNLRLEFEWSDGVPCDVLTDLEKSIGSALTAFASWIYKQLQTDYEYQISDECIVERDDRYDEDGNVI